MKFYNKIKQSQKEKQLEACNLVPKRKVGRNGFGGEMSINV